MQGKGKNKLCIQRPAGYEGLQRVAEELTWMPCFEANDMGTFIQSDGDVGMV
jgi:hypothetical protein